MKSLMTYAKQAFHNYNCVYIYIYMYVFFLHCHKLLSTGKCQLVLMFVFGAVLGRSSY